MGLLTIIFDINGLILLFAAFVAAYIYMTRNFGYWKKRHIKEIPPWAFFGNFAECLLMRKPPIQFMQEMYEAAKSEKFIGFYILDKPHLIVRDPEYIKHILIKDFDVFHDRHVSAGKNDMIGNKNLFLMKGPLWRIFRQSMSKWFTSGKLKKIFERMPDVASDLDKYLVTAGVNDNKRAVDVTELSYKLSTDLIGMTVFGMKFNALNNPKSEFYEHYNHILRSTYVRGFEFLSSFFMPQFLNVFGIQFFTRNSTKFLKTAFIETLYEKKTAGSEKIDFFDFLIDLKNELISSNKQKYNFTDEELAAQAVLLFFAGLGTSSITTMFTLYQLAKNPKIQEKLREEIKSAMEETNEKFTYSMVNTLPYLEAVISESLRMYPTLPFLDRVATSKYTFPDSNVTIEKDTPVYIPMLPLQMDPKYFPNPEIYQPDRFYGENKFSINKYTYFPFGDGPHVCIGMRLGLLITKFITALIISKYVVELCKETTDPVEFNPTGTFLAAKSNIKLKMKTVDY